MTAPLRRSFIEGRTSLVMVTAARRLAETTALRLPSRAKGRAAASPIPRLAPARRTAWPSSPRSMGSPCGRKAGEAHPAACSARLELEDVVPDLLGVLRVRLQLQVAAER